MRLYLLQLGLLPAFGDVPVPGYLIQTNDGTNVLVDTGCPRGVYGRVAAAAAEVLATSREDAGMARFMAGIVGALRDTPADLVTSRLAEIGLAPGDIDYLVCSHFDWDHAGNHDLFPRAELVVQRRHYDAALAHPRFQLFGAPWKAPGLRYRLVDGDAELLPGLRLIESGGHVPGHQSVLVRLPQTGQVLLAVDALTSAGRLGPGAPPQTQDMDHEEAQRTAARLGALAEREGVRLIVFGHDGAQWPTLRRAPEFYA